MAAEQGAALGRHAALHRCLQAADRGDRADAEGQAGEHDAHAAYAAAQIPQRQPERERSAQAAGLAN
jgi:hypothetical protein